MSRRTRAMEAMARLHYDRAWWSYPKGSPGWFRGMNESSELDRMVSFERRCFGYDPHFWDRENRRRFVAYFWFVGWDCVQLGIHLCVSLPNVEVHVPFGFFRVGWVKR